MIVYYSLTSVRLFPFAPQHTIEVEGEFDSWQDCAEFLSDLEQSLSLDGPIRILGKETP